MDRWYMEKSHFSERGLVQVLPLETSGDTWRHLEIYGHVGLVQNLLWRHTGRGLQIWRRLEIYVSSNQIILNGCNTTRAIEPYRYRDVSRVARPSSRKTMECWGTRIGNHDLDVFWYLALPVHEAADYFCFVVCASKSHFCFSSVENGDDGCSLLDLLRSTLPLYHGVGIRREACHRKLEYTSG
jgi:hypothetical protein